MMSDPEKTAQELWNESVGPFLYGESVANRLGVPPYTLPSLVKEDQVLALPTHKSPDGYIYPQKQFRSTVHGALMVRPEWVEVLSVFTRIQMDPWIIATWASAPGNEALDGKSPWGYLAEENGSNAALLEAEKFARRWMR